MVCTIEERIMGRTTEGLITITIIEERITAMASTVAQMGLLAIIVLIGDSAIAAAMDLQATIAQAVRSTTAAQVDPSDTVVAPVSAVVVPVAHSAVAVPVDPLAAAVAAAVTEA